MVWKVTLFQYRIYPSIKPNVDELRASDTT